MAQDVAITLWCDWCDLLGLEYVPADHQHVIAVDGEARRVDLCDRCHLELEPLHALYQQRGQEIEQAAAKRTKKTGQSRDEPVQVPKPARAPQNQTALQPPLSESSEARRRRGGRERDRGKPYVICPLDHPHSGTGPMQISYEGRGSHADMVHGLHFTEIRWEDPEGLLTIPCTVHQRCLDSTVRFKNRAGLTNHISRSGLPHLDGGDSTPDGQDCSRAGSSRPDPRLYLPVPAVEAQPAESAVSQGPEWGQPVLTVQEHSDPLDRQP